MNVLVIDTALGLCTAAVCRVEAGDGAVTTLSVRSLAMTTGHQERLAGLVRDVVHDMGGVDQLDRIGVTVGPGSFTGLRVGMAFAQGLATALNRPIVGVSALDALAVDTRIQAGTAVGAVIDARRGQVYARFWQGGAALGPAAALSLETAQEQVALMGSDSTLIGSGAEIVAPNRSNVRRIPAAGPSPEALARLTTRGLVDGSSMRPLYLRAPDATPPTRLPGQARPVRP